MNSDEAWIEMREANAQVELERNTRSGQPSLAAIDRLTDAVSAYMAAVKREAAKALASA